MTTTWTIPTVGAWAGSLRFAPMARAQEIAAELEELGYGVLWFPESDSRDPFMNIALLLSATRRLMGGTAIANVWARDAMAMSCAAKALTEAFPDRLLLGLGIGHKRQVEGWRGHTYAKPFDTMKNYLDGMDGATYSAVAPTTPVRRLLSALGPRMLQLAAERTDGTIPYLSPPEQVAISRAFLPDSALVCPVQTVVLETDRPTAIDLARRAHVAFYMNLPNYTNNLRRHGFTPEHFLDGGSDRLIDAVVAWGSPEQIVRRLQASLDAGADHVTVQVVTAEPAPPLAIWRELAPALKSLTPTRGAT